MHHSCLALLLVSQLLFGCEPVQKSPVQAASLVHAKDGPVSEVVAEAQQAAVKSGQRLMVYVGASWCEPCEVFLQALKQKSLPQSLSTLQFLKFDHDKDEERLKAAGYGGSMLPRFVLPGRGGEASEQRFEGSTKGPSAIDNIIPRLEALLQTADYSRR